MRNEEPQQVRQALDEEGRIRGKACPPGGTYEGRLVEDLITGSTCIKNKRSSCSLICKSVKEAEILDGFPAHVVAFTRPWSCSPTMALLPRRFGT